MVFIRQSINRFEETSKPLIGMRNLKLFLDIAFFITNSYSMIYASNIYADV